MKTREYILGAALLAVSATVLTIELAPRISAISYSTRKGVGETGVLSRRAVPPRSDRKSLQVLVSVKPFTPRSAVVLARSGDKEALKFVSEYFEKEFQARAQLLGEQDRKEKIKKLEEDIYAELGVSREEFETLDAAHAINLHLELIRGENGLENFVQDMEDSNVQLMGENKETVRDTLTSFKFFQILLLLCENANQSGPYNPALMQALGMDRAEFQNLVDEVYQYTSRDADGNEYQLQLVAYLRYVYKIP